MNGVTTRKLLIILSVFIVVDLVLFAWFTNIIPISGTVNKIIPQPKLSATSEVKGVAFTLKNEKLLLQELSDIGFFDKNRVLNTGTAENVTIEHVLFKLVNTEQSGNRINGSDGRNSFSVGQIYDPANHLMTINLYLSPETIKGNSSDILAKYATTNIMVYIYTITGNFTTNPRDFIQQFGLTAQKVLKKGILFNVNKLM